MSVDRPLSSLNLYDVLTDLIPGVTFVGAVAFLIRFEEIEVLDLGAMIALIAVGGYVSGHILQSARSKVWGTPDLFQRVVSSLDDGAETTPLGDVTDVEASFLNRCRQEFELDDDFKDWLQLFKLLMSYLETRPEQRALRFQALHSFYWSMAAAFGSISLLALGSIVAIKIANPELLRSIETLSGVLLVSIFLTAVFEFRRREFQRHFIRYLIIDFHVATTRNNIK